MYGDWPWHMTKMSLKLPRNWDFSTFRAESAKIARSKSVMPGEGSPGSCRPGSPRTLDRPLKTGWLRKQRSIVKNWQMRYFVLKGNKLFYHKDDKEAAYQGSIPLKSSQVNELPSNPDEPGKFLFEIIPGSNGDKERDSCVLMANSQNEMEEWVRAIRRVIGLPSGGAVFGRSLGDIITYEQRFGPQQVPILVQKCAEFIREHGLAEEGIFRLPGQDNQVKHLRDAFDAGERPSFPSDTDVHTVASLFKLYLRELPEPVVPWAQYQDFLECSKYLDPNSLAGRDKLEAQISLLPRANYDLLSYICRFLYEVQQNSKVNKMSVENLATVFGVNLLKPQMEDPFIMMRGTPQIQKLMTVMIRQHEDLFPPSKDVLTSPPCKKNESKASAPRSFVGWDVAEDPAEFSTTPTEMSSLSEFPEEGDTGAPSSEREAGEGSEAAADTQPSCLFSPSSSATDPWTGSPRKRTQTLPALNYPGRAGHEADKLRKVSEGTVEEMPPSPPLTLDIDGQKGTFSEDIFKILDLQRVSLFTGTQKNGSQAERGSGGPDRRGSNSAASQNSLPKARCGSSSSSSSGSPLFRSPPSQEEIADVGADQKKLDASTTLPTQRLRDPSKKPSSDQEEDIQSLLQKNGELTATVAELRSALEAERRRVSALEIRLRNAESSRDEALQRNRELDQEIQKFLSSRPL
ncbi:rho GTPase-activating protein 25 [Scleropages formosus]|uniref:Rho GTPase activating protein 25 n=1 Tax=Scleropages formosus TaxID=113540 RepID=A0A8C9S534_SCLFO|nr:rho GTPase-activating protein 25 [Scleropages formosus]